MQHDVHSCRVSGASPTQPDSYDIDLEVPAPTMDQATAPLLHNLNNSREIEQVSFLMQSTVLVFVCPPICLWLSAIFRRHDATRTKSVAAL